MNISVILGTSRVGRQSEKVAKFMLSEIEKAGHKSEIIDIHDYPLTATDNTEKSELAKNLESKIASADALIIVSPEYNHGYPGELKMTLDLLWEQYAKKPVGFCGVSSGMMGGVRAVEQLRLVAIQLQMIPIFQALYFPKAQELFDEDGGIKDASYHKTVQSFLKNLASYVKK
ncbi:MAG: NADPH-dependent FMN reductase [Candidatus Micrarchaeota archaeon]